MTRFDPAHLPSADGPELPKKNLFQGPNGIRAGWRVLAAFAIFLALVAIIGRVLSLGLRLFKIHISGGITPEAVLIGEGVSLSAYLLTAWIMSRIESRNFQDYGFGSNRAFGPGFWVSAAGGIAALSTLLAAIHVLGGFHLGPIELHGALAWKYAVAWAVAFLAVAVFEENGLRGYLLFTLTTGMTFWPAAMLSSVIFGSIHLANGGENRVGILSAMAVGFFFCIVIRKAGTLWPAIGFHFAWDWAETYLYGTPDSGIVAPGHLLNAQFNGPLWLTGGSAGPEASWLCVVLLVLLCIGVGQIPGAKYPDAEAIARVRAASRGAKA